MYRNYLPKWLPSHWCRIMFGAISNFLILFDTIVYSYLLLWELTQFLHTAHFSNLTPPPLIYRLHKEYWKMALAYSHKNILQLSRQFLTKIINVQEDSAESLVFYITLYGVRISTYFLNMERWRIPWSLH